MNKANHMEKGKPETESISTSTRKKINMLLDVPVRSQVVVAKTRRSVWELMELKPGMIVETDNNISDLVELQINDQVIALGEVVIVGENYGLRVKKIISPASRIKKLK